jgi:hypothetical protein
MCNCTGMSLDVAIDYLHVSRSVHAGRDESVVLCAFMIGRAIGRYIAGTQDILAQG